jgi:hypothetical protein
MWFLFISTATVADPTALAHNQNGQQCNDDSAGYPNRYGCNFTSLQTSGTFFVQPTFINFCNNTVSLILDWG